MDNNFNEVSLAGTGNPEEGNVQETVNVEQNAASQEAVTGNENREMKIESAETPSSDSASETPAEEDGGAKAGSGILEEILASGEQFEDAVESATALDLVFLMERFSEAEGDSIRQLVPKYLILRKAFEKMLKAENAESAEGLESRFQTAYAKFNARRGEAEAKLEKEREENSVKKSELLAKLKEIVEGEKAEAIQEVRDIQKSWKETGWVKQEDREPFNEKYVHYLDLFYNLRGRYNELLDIDRKHNLDEKQDLIRKAEALIPTDNSTSSDSWRAISEQIRDFQEMWKAIGPVPRDNHESINETWKNLLDKFYAKRQEYYELQDGERKVNSEKKTALLESMRQYSSFKADKVKDWSDATEKLLALQKEWQEIGPGTSEVNKNLWKEYREIFDAFFKNKGDFFNALKEERNRNLSMKMSLIERAEGLAESTDWRETSKLLRQLQEDWKKTGPVPDRISNKIWHRFRQACDTFFNARDAHMKAAGNDQDQNLQAKLAMIEQLKALPGKEGSVQEKQEEFDRIHESWKATGHVPFEKKDEINKAFRDATMEISKVLRGGGYNYNRGSGGGGNFRRYEGGENTREHASALTGEDRVKAELSKMKERIEIAQKKISTLENNILMVAKGKSGDGLRAQFQSQIDEEKQRLEGLKTKVKELRAEAEKEKAAAAAASEAAAAEPAAEETPGA